ncbi:MAG: hypothetical protein ACFFEU_07945 [Candidatus Thorarchaeota archaeon]
MQPMVVMGAKAFPRTQREPNKRILLIPILLMIGGLLLNLAHPYFRFIGTVIALAGSLSVFLVGMVFADLWVSARRTKQFMKERQARMNEQGDTFSEEGFDGGDITSPDPFTESFDEED